MIPALSRMALFFLMVISAVELTVGTGEADLTLVGVCMFFWLCGYWAGWTERKKDLEEWLGWKIDP